MQSIAGKLSVFSSSGTLYTYEQPAHVSIYQPGKQTPSRLIEVDSVRGRMLRMFLAADERFLVLSHESVVYLDLQTRKVSQKPVFNSAFAFKDALIFVLFAEDPIQTLKYLDLSTGETRSLDSIKVSASPLAILHHQESDAVYVHERSGLLSVYLSGQRFASDQVGRGDLHLLADGSPMVIDAQGVSLYNGRLEKMSTIPTAARGLDSNPLFRPICSGEILVGTWDRTNVGFKMLSVPDAPLIVLSDVSDQGTILDFSISPDLSSVFLMLENRDLKNRAGFFREISLVPRMFPIFTRRATGSQSSDFEFPFTATLFSTGEITLGRADGKSLLRYDDYERSILFATMQSYVSSVNSSRGSTLVTIGNLQDRAGYSGNKVVIYENHPEEIELGLAIVKREERIDNVSEKSPNLERARFAQLQAFSMMRGIS